MEAFLLVLKLTAEYIEAQLPIFACLILEVLEHPVGSDIVTVHLADVHEALLHSEELRLVELDHVGELALLLRELRVLLLLFPQLRGRLQQGLEILLVALRLEKVYFS